MQIRKPTRRTQVEQTLWTIVPVVLLATVMAQAANTTAPSAATQPTDVVLQGATTQPAAQGQPIIKADELEHNFGTKWVGGTLKHAFTLTNAGDADLKITRVKPACGCTVAGQYPKTIKPGESGSFPFSIRTSKFHGKYTRSISISSNDPKTPTLRLKLSGENTRYVEVTPPSVYFAPLMGDKPQERVLKITNNADKPLELKLVTPTTRPGQNQVKFELTEKTAGKAFELRVTSVPPYQPGNFNVTAKLQTNLDAQKTVDVYVRGRVPQRLDVSPNPLFIRESQRGEKRYYPATLNFINNSGSPVKLLEASVDDPALETTIRETKPGERYYVRITIPEGYEPKKQGSTLTLKTDDTQTPVITVPVRSPSYRPPSTAKRKKRPRPALKMIGKKTPAFTLTTLKGEAVSDASLKDIVAVLNFVAPNCGYCKRQIPEVEKVRADYEQKGVRFLNVSQTMRKPYTNEQVVEIFKKVGSNIEIAPDPKNKVGKLFKATSLPTMMVIDKTGTIKHVNIGSGGGKLVRGQLEELLGIKSAASKPATPTPVAAPRQEQPNKTG